MEPKNEGMLKKLQQRYPIAIAEFTHWFVSGYQTEIIIYEEAPFIERCREICRFLGYPLNIDLSAGKQPVIDKIKAYLEEYDQVRQKYPEGLVDPFKKLNNLAYSERIEHHVKNFEMNRKLMTFRDCLQRTDIVKRSFRDSLYKLQVPITRIIKEDTFWEDIKKHNPRLHAKVPF